MGLEHLFAGLIAGWIVNRKDKNKSESFYTSPTHLSVSERLFVNARRKHIAVEYVPVNYALLANSGRSQSIYNLDSLEEYQRAEILMYYSRLESNPNSIECRTELVHYLFNLWRNEDHVELIDIIQNELIYLIDHIHPISQQERMYQHLAMFLSSECYFIQGELGNALKRLYQVLDWQEIYDNVEDKDGIDFNGLSNFHQSVISNIINIYGLVGLKEKSEDFVHSCKGVVADMKKTLNSIKSDNISNVDFYNFINDTIKALTPSNQMEGYYFFANTNYNENFFKESCTTIIRGQAIYSIDCFLTAKKEISIKDSFGVYEGVFSTYPTLWFGYNGGIINYQAVIERERKIIENI